MASMRWVLAFGWFMRRLFGGEEVKVNKHDHSTIGQSDEESREFREKLVILEFHSSALIFRKLEYFKPTEARPIFSSSIGASRHKSCFTSHKSSIVLLLIPQMSGRKTRFKPNSYVNSAVACAKRRPRRCWTHTSQIVLPGKCLVKRKRCLFSACC